MQTTLEAFYLLTPRGFSCWRAPHTVQVSVLLPKSKVRLLLGTAPAYGENVVISTSVDRFSFHQFLHVVSIHFSFAKFSKFKAQHIQGYQLAEIHCLFSARPRCGKK